MRSGLLGVLSLLLVLAPLASLAQTQPASPPDGASYLVREDLAPAGSLEGALRVLRFVQVSDAHILDDDAPYPVRQEPLDPYITAFSTAAQRPQDEFTDEVLDSVVQAINGLHAQDALQFVMNTGDNIDNDLENELARFIDLYDGTTTTSGPLSGLPCRPDGQSTGVDDTAHDVTDACTSLPEALSANHSGLAPGLPWYSAFGNHDALIQGNVNPNPLFDAIAGDSGRHLLTQPDYVAMHFPGAASCVSTPAGSPADDFGHGYGFAGDRLCDGDPDNDGYYSFDVGGVHVVVLDTVNDDFATASGHWPGIVNPQAVSGADIIGGYAEGSVDPVQGAWLDAELAANTDRLVVVFSHHTVNSMFTKLAEGYCQDGVGCLSDLLEQSGYRTGQALIDQLAQQPNVVAWFGGHTHRHRIEAKTAGDGGFWNIESSSLIDFPQEARAIELWVTADGTKGFWRIDDFGHAFQLSKDLEATDPQREVSAAGEAKDQDALLWFDVPAGVQVQPQPAAQSRLIIRLADGVNATVGTAAEVRVRITDNATGAGVDGLQVTLAIVHGPFVCAGQPAPDIAITDFANPPEMSGEGNGTYRTSFNPVDPGTHYLTVSAQAKPPYEAKAQLLSLDVKGGDQAPCPEGKKSPDLGVPLLVAVVVALALVRRRP